MLETAVLLTQFRVPVPLALIARREFGLEVSAQARPGAAA